MALAYFHAVDYFYLSSGKDTHTHTHACNTALSYFRRKGGKWDMALEIQEVCACVCFKWDRSDVLMGSGLFLLIRGNCCLSVYHRLEVYMGTKIHTRT